MTKMHTSHITALAAIMALVLIPGTKQGHAFEAISADQLAEYCGGASLNLSGEVMKKQPGLYCDAYIHGFLDGAVTTDPVVSQNVVKEIDNNKSLRDRAISTRIKQRLERDGPSYYAEFCIPDPVPLETIIGLVKQSVQEKDHDESARELVYRVIRRNYPCNS